MQTTSNALAWEIVIIILVNAYVLMGLKALRASTSLVLMIATATGNVSRWQRLLEAIQ
jgi:hypothetical protein